MPRTTRLNMEHSGLEPSAHNFLSQSTNEVGHRESETSASELGLDGQPDDSPPHRTPIGVRTDRPPQVSSHQCSKKKLLRANKRSGRGSGDLQVIQRFQDCHHSTD